MAEESFILLSLKESKAKKLAQVISNETSRRILDHLSKEDSTESKIAKELGLPISTVHYNLKHLVDNRLVLADEYHYSEKGREVIHYRLAKKLIVIAPQDADESSLMAALKSIMPVGIFALAAAGLVHFFTRTADSALVVMDSAPAPMLAKIAEAPEADMAMERAVEESANFAVQTASVPVHSEPNLALWFLAGAAFTLLVAFLVIWLRGHMERR